MCLSLSPFAVEANFDHDKQCGWVESISQREGFPWPWSDQCEFTWRDIEGKWRIGPFSYYVMEAYGDTNQAEHTIVIREFDNFGKLIASGQTLHVDGSKEMLVPMQWVQDSVDGAGYWMQISWVADENFEAEKEEKKDCSSTKNRYLAAKVTSFGLPQDDYLPDILEKIPD